jgi:hypothetical protein
MYENLLRNLRDEKELFEIVPSERDLRLREEIAKFTKERSLGMAVDPPAFLGSSSQIVAKIGGSTLRYDVLLGTIPTTTDTDIVTLQAAIDALPSTGGVIDVTPLFDGDNGDAVIAKNNVTIRTGIKSNLAGLNTWQAPRLRKITIDATSQVVKNIEVQGFMLREFNNYANGNNIGHVYLKDSVIWNTTTASERGVRVTGSSYCYFLKLIDCRFNDHADQTSLLMGAVNIESVHDGNGQVHIIRGDYKPRANGAVFLSASGRMIQIVIDGLSHVIDGYTGCAFLHLKTEGMLSDVHVMNSLFEEHNAMTVFNIDHGGVAGRQMLYCDFSHNTFSITSGQTVTFINNLATLTDWYDGVNNGIQALDNFIKVNWAYFELGTLAENARFKCDFTRVISPFVDGSFCGDHGWNIDAADECASTFIQVPKNASKVLMIRIYGYTNVSESDGMELEITASGAGDNEPYATEAISVLSKGSKTTGMTAGDVILWELTPADDADIGHLQGGDNVELKVAYSAADGANCATNVSIRAIEVLYI